MITRISVAVLTLAMLALPVLSVLADTVGVVPAPDANKYANVNGFILLMQRIISILFTVLIILAVIFIIWAAFQYLTAGGDAEKVSAAGRSVLYAVVAIAIAILARAVPGLVCNILDLGTACNLLSTG